MPNIPFFNYPAVFTSYQKEFLDAFENVGSRGAFIMQSDLKDFEAELAETAGVSHAVGVANATDALELIIRFLNKPNGEVLVSDHTMSATASAAVENGLTPVAVDFDASLTMCPKSLEKSVGPNTVGVMPTQLNGRIADMEPIQSICEKHNLFLVEDSAQALSAKYKGQSAGSFGVGGCISFYPAKVVGCLGDAGAIVTNNSELAEWALSARDHGRDPESGKTVMWGRNTRMDNMQAAFLSIVLKDYPEIMDRRREMADLYHGHLKDVDQLKLPKPPAQESADEYCIFQNYEINALERDGLKQHLSDQGIGSIIQWGGQRISEICDTELRHAPYADENFKNLLLVPFHLALTDDDIKEVSEAIKSFYASR
ncbi:MAG: DegT/DnrJ/EryC1/StrS family aminotransferase [Parasphingorhabdus sp.]|uniref:DegT/DnrJ/EryC1/StrS family aminotransferase n=1 Tax=Parasphingorhabdus sp. TaxID=2709688 RepID=UPI0032985A97